MIASILLASVLTCVPPSDSSLVGFWESAATSRGGIGQAIELKANGELLSATTVIVDQVYRATDGTLFIAGSTEALRGATGGTAFTVTGDLLVQTDGQGGEIRKERLGAPGQGPSLLVGAWRYRHYTGAIAFERYTEDGRVLFRLPMTSQHGCYRARGGSLSLDTVERKSTMQYALVEAALTLRNADGRSYVYRRAEPWYPRDRVDFQPPKGDTARPGAWRHGASRPAPAGIQARAIRSASSRAQAMGSADITSFSAPPSPNARVASMPSLAVSPSGLAEGSRIAPRLPLITTRS